ncbi:family 43 glycosylhydrolase [Streptomyces sp. CG1]|uniref:family 43 glycosylhydrolase n=1 Tax=Streptomyces sp. CG1 TaxID=1287523 RepID=UPI0034E217BF
MAGNSSRGRAAWPWPAASASPHSGAACWTPGTSACRQIIHDPTVHRLEDGRYVACSTGGIIGARLSMNLRDCTDAGNAFTAPPSWWYDYKSTADPWAPGLTYCDGRYWLYCAVSSWGTNHSAIGVATSPTGLPGTWTDRGKAFGSAKTDTWNALDPAVIRADGRLWMAFGSYDADDNGTPKLGLNQLSWRTGWPVVK